jgi:flagellar hook-length control protein FliK
MKESRVQGVSELNTVGSTGQTISLWADSSAVQHSEAGAVASAGSTTPSKLSSTETMTSSIVHQIVQTAKISLADGGGNISLRLDPPHLGSVDMTVNTDRGMVTAHINASSDASKVILESSLPVLRQTLADAGIHVDSITVSVGGNGGQSLDTQHNQQDGQPGRSRLRQDSPSRNSASTTDQSTVVESVERLGSNSRIDYLV